MVGSTEGLLILLVILVLFGGSQVPKLARALGSSVNSFKKGLKEGEEEELETTLKKICAYKEKIPDEQKELNETAQKTSVEKIQPQKNSKTKRKTSSRKKSGQKKGTKKSEKK